MWTLGFMVKMKRLDIGDVPGQIENIYLVHESVTIILRKTIKTSIKKDARHQKIRVEEYGIREKITRYTGTGKLTYLYQLNDHERRFVSTIHPHSMGIHHARDIVCISCFSLRGG